MPIPAEADHHIVCECRRHLSDALRAMLHDGYMTTPDWLVAQQHAAAALGNLTELLRMHTEEDVRAEHAAAGTDAETGTDPAGSPGRPA
jgi:protein-disulfide isomerase